MKFYSKITNKPNSIFEEVRHGDKIINRKLVAKFEDGVFETDDPEVIEKLQAHPDKFRIDKPWDVSIRWQDTEEGKKLLKKADKLGIKYNDYTRKEYLQQLVGNNDDDNMTYREVIAKAKELNIPTHKRKKEDILNDLKKEVINNG